jgi:hypothetical protein
MTEMTTLSTLALCSAMVLAALALTAYEFRRMTDLQGLRVSPSARRARD